MVPEKRGGLHFQGPAQTGGPDRRERTGHGLTQIIRLGSPNVLFSGLEIEKEGLLYRLKG